MKSLVAEIGIAALLSSCGATDFDDCTSKECCQEAYDDCYLGCRQKEDEFDRAQCWDLCQTRYEQCLKRIKGLDYVNDLDYSSAP